MRRNQAGQAGHGPLTRRAHLLACWLSAPLILGLGLGLACPSAHAQAGPAAGSSVPAPGVPAASVPEENVKAAFIFNFAVFTEWPLASLAAGAPMTLCTFPGNSLHAALAGLGEKLVNGHALLVRQLVLTAATTGLRACHILVLGNGDRERWGQVRKDLAGASVLTVADEPGIGEDGAVITLELENRRVSFDIALGAARQSNLMLSSKLLRLARSVQ